MLCHVLKLMHTTKQILKIPDVGTNSKLWQVPGGTVPIGGDPVTFPSASSQLTFLLASLTHCPAQSWWGRPDREHCSARLSPNKRFLDRENVLSEHTVLLQGGDSPPHTEASVPLKSAGMAASQGPEHHAEWHVFPTKQSRRQKKPLFNAKTESTF